MYVNVYEHKLPLKRSNKLEQLFSYFYRHFDTPEKKEELYAELKAAAESGWDFSTRWFILNGTNKGKHSLLI